MFGPESKLFPRASKLKGPGNSQYPGQQEGDIPNWKEKYVYALDREVMDLNTGLYYRCIQEHTASEIFANDLINGYWILMISGGSSSVKYSNVCFVDPFSGVDGTALPGRFDLPFLTPEAALLAANALAPTLHSRAMVWIRKGVYTSVQANAYNNVDVYCEPGVVFNSYFTLTDQFVGATNFNWYGSAKWDLGMSSSAFKWMNASTILVEGDSFVNSGPISLCYNVLVGTSNVTYNFNSMESTQTLGTGYAFSWRNNCNGTVNVKNYIKSNQVSHDIRAGHFGNVLINCPKNILTAYNLYGGGFKCLVYSNAGTVDSNFTINGDLISETPNLGSSTTLVLQFLGCSATININGNIYSNDIRGIFQASSSVNAKIIVNGSIFSNYIPVVLSSAGSIYLRNGIACLKDVIGALNVIYITSTGSLWIQNYSLNNQFNSDVISQLSKNSKIYMLNVQSEGALAAVGLYFINAIDPGTLDQFTNCVSNLKLNPNVANQLAQGFIYDALLKTPKF
jgi:hypothetical protein